MILFRQVDRRYPFLREGAGQPEGRWNRTGKGPVQYFADSPDGAWAEFLRHEGIRSPEDLPGIARSMWAVEMDAPPRGRPRLSHEILTGSLETYARCHAEADRLVAKGQRGLSAPSAALLDGQANGWQVRSGLQPGPWREGQVVVLFGPQPDLVGWQAAENGRPSATLLPKVRHL